MEVDIFLENTFKPDVSDERITLPNLCIADYKRYSKTTSKNAKTED